MGTRTFDYSDDDDQPRRKKSSTSNSSSDKLLKDLNAAKWILIVVGIITVIAHIYFLSQAAFAAQTAILVVFLLFGVGFIVLGVFVKDYPVPMTITGLVLYSLGTLVDFIILASLGGLEFKNFRMYVIKIAIVVALAKAVKSAFDYEAELKRGRSRRRNDDDDYDDEPRSRRRNDDDDDDDDRPHRRRRDDDDDDDRPRGRARDDDDDDRPCRRSRSEDNDDDDARDRRRGDDRSRRRRDFDD